MSPSNRSFCHKIILKPLLFMASGILLVIGNGVAIAHEKAEDKITIENSYLTSQVVTAEPLLAQTTPIPTVAPAEPVVAQRSSSQNTERQQIVQVIEDDSEAAVEPAVGSSLVLEATESVDGAAPVSLRAADLAPNPDNSAVSTAASEGSDVAQLSDTEEPVDTEGAVDTEEEPATEEAGEPASVSSTSLEVPARFGINAGTATNGFGETIGIHGFVPLEQKPGETVTFLEGNLQLNDEDPSFSLNVGHRGYDPENDRIRGGYIGVDGRSTGESTFFQLASGYERIDEDWEFRFNGYLPVGERTNTVQSVEPLVQTSSSFQGNQLVLSAIRDGQRILQQEDALGGFDAEIGTELADWNGGELMGYAGGYLLSGEESSLGGQLRLAANFESNFNAGLSLQHDGLFGTTVAFSVSATWPNTRFQDEDEEAFQDEFEVPIRLRDSIARRQNVAINEISESETIYEEQIEPLRNPQEEDSYRFIHVALGGAAGDGTYETPFATVEDAIALINTDANTYSDGNTIVYVDGENAATATIPGFTVPDRVRVLSQGPEQIIAGMEFPGFSTTATRLPFSVTQMYLRMIPTLMAARFHCQTLTMVSFPRLRGALPTWSP